MALRSSGPLLLLLCALIAVTEGEKRITGIAGKAVELNCVYPKEEKFILNNLRVYWQTESCVVHALYSGKDNETHHCEVFRKRTRLFPEKMEKGDFSLLLLDISPKDEDTYRCIIQRNSTYFHVIHQDEVKLSIAGNYSQPILGESRENTDPGEERTLTCTSSNGYPEPNIYWINQTDGSFLDSARTEFIPNTDGTYNVSSTLKIKITRDVRIECTIENEQLVQNLTSFYTCDPDTDTKTQIDSKPGAKVASVIAVVILIIVLVILTSWLWKRKSAQLKSYAGVQRIEDGRLDNSYV